MPTFKYTAKNQESKTVAGKISADTKAAVIEELRKRQLTITGLEEIKSVRKAKASASKKKVKIDEIVIFSRQLATMVEAGIPIIQALNTLADQITHPRFQKVIREIETDIQHGSSLSAGFAKHDSVFDPLFINMVKVGETGGVLSQVLERIANYMEKTVRLQRKVKAALIYPSVVVSMAVIITILLLVKVVPTFKGIYDSFNAELPAMTQLLIAISDTVQHHLLWLVGIIVVFVFVLKRWHKTDKGGIVIDSALLRMPVFGELLRKVAISRFSRTLATLIQSGVPILESLDIVQKSSGNRLIERVVEDVKANVREGESIAAPLERSKIFPPMVTRMIAIGEKSGQLEKMLSKVASFYDEQVDAAVEGLTSIIEPLIIGFLGIVIGFIVVALFLPIMNITQIL